MNLGVFVIQWGLVVIKNRVGIFKRTIILRMVVRHFVDMHADLKGIKEFIEF